MVSAGHDVPILNTQIQDQAGKLVMAGATKDMVKLLPRFEYANDTGRRDHFVSTAGKAIAMGKTKVTDLENKAGAAATDAKAKSDLQITALQVDVKSAETRLTELKQANSNRWTEFEAGVSAATARLRKSVNTATG